VRSVGILCSLVFALVVPGSALGAVEVAVSAEDGILYVDAHFSEVFDDDLELALQSGLPARISIELVLWEERSGLWDREVLRDQWTVSVVFDVVAEDYAVFDVEGASLLESGELMEVEDFVSGIELWPLCELGELEAGRPHYLGVRLVIEPLSIEEVRDLERWLRGNVRQGATLRDVPGQLVGILRNRLGLGAQSERGRSPEFRPGELPPPR
jgi:hypothetical protein